MQTFVLCLFSILIGSSSTALAGAHALKSGVYKGTLKLEDDECWMEVRSYKPQAGPLKGDLATIIPGGTNDQMDVAPGVQTAPNGARSLNQRIWVGTKDDNSAVMRVDFLETGDVKSFVYASIGKADNEPMTIIRCEGLNYEEDAGPEYRTVLPQRKN